MTHIPSIDAFWTLYLINVLQPVDVTTLSAETERLWKSQARSGEVNATIATSLNELIESDLVAIEENQQYAVTLLGLERLSLFKLGRIRDKNRLFLLKKEFKER
ncbi:MAG TPA: hypothetical protein VFQ41_13320 [Candidatus Angelobacter sp.]|nr:hypothetical protein [Candidatus Angelobacter sp.]